MGFSTIYAVHADGYGTLWYFTKELARQRADKWLSVGYTVSESYIALSLDPE